MIELIIFLIALLFLVPIGIAVSIFNSNKSRNEYDLKVFNLTVNYLKNSDFEEIILLQNRYSIPKFFLNIAEAGQNNNISQFEQLIQSDSSLSSHLNGFLTSIYILQAKKRLKNKEYDIAIIWYLGAIKREYTFQTLYELGYCYLKQQQYQEAIKYFKKSLHCKNSFIALYNLFLANSQLCNKDTFENLKELRQKFPLELSQKGQILLEIPFEHLTEVQ